jgi:hypothetical protein
VTPRACAPYRARTKGKDERGVGYVKRNALAGRRFNSLEHLSEHLAWWMREVSDVRIHGTTGERPIDRFESERERLRPVDGRPPFHQVRELERVVQSDCFIDIDTNRYSVPWTLIGQRLTAQVIDGVVRLLMAGRLVAEHVEAHGTRQMVRDSEHFAGLAGGPRPETQMQTELPLAPTVPPELLRPLSVYEELVGGGW